jgi:hypothetical protein
MRRESRSAYLRPRRDRPARVHQITAATDLDELDVILGELQPAAWLAAVDPGRDDNAELAGAT